MVELKTKITESGVLYIPKELREAFGRKMKIIANATASVFFPANASYADVLYSLEIIRKDLEHRLRLQKEKGKKG
jgi:bifunctional DNA-binding transcriptional regulator/antitoxin component of YhaV-PrlF toxin-antitoxin module